MLKTDNFSGWYHTQCMHIKNIIAFTRYDTSMFKDKINYWFVLVCYLWTHKCRFNNKMVTNIIFTCAVHTRVHACTWRTCKHVCMNTYIQTHTTPTEYTTLHYATTLHYTTLHYITLHYTTLLYYTTLHYTYCRW